MAVFILSESKAYIVVKGQALFYNYSRVISNTFKLHVFKLGLIDLDCKNLDDHRLDYSRVI